MFTNTFQKLKTNLRLAVNRLKLLQKKKTELAQKARKEIADYIAAGKFERAKIRVEYIIREDYLVEAMEIVEMYCDLLLARFGLIQQMKTLDEGLAESISSLIWVAPRLQTDVQELKVVADQLAVKYGKPYAQACRDNAVGTVAPKLIHKMSIQAPPKILVERYLMEIAKSHDIAYEPDPQVMQGETTVGVDALLIDLNKKGGPGDSAGGGGGGGGGGVAGFPDPPGFKDFPGQPVVQMPGAVGGMSHKPFDYAPQKPFAPPVDNGFGMFNPSVDTPAMPPSYPSLDPREAKEMEANSAQGGGGYMHNMPPPPYPGPSNFLPAAPTVSKPTPAPRGKTSPVPPPGGNNEDPDPLLSLPAVPTGLPDVPSHSPTHGNTNNTSNVAGGSNPEDSIDFDDLTKRFENLKRKK
ncbi:unnamed protein product [Notodromas monacha]|uniref:IST1 homolog n=1 Tax=Notodromas monacha TaxID=399045 RepID=A0A7R9BEE0_9CRUS|nr:unnamed protein product [Notodromas monacha]CAG0913137.1 unnamed protein product [Notodromas monacha]